MCVCVCEVETIFEAYGLASKIEQYKNYRKSTTSTLDSQTEIECRVESLQKGIEEIMLFQFKALKFRICVIFFFLENVICALQQQYGVNIDYNTHRRKKKSRKISNSIIKSITWIDTWFQLENVFQSLVELKFWSPVLCKKCEAKAIFSRNNSKTKSLVFWTKWR